MKKKKICRSLKPMKNFTFIDVMKFRSLQDINERIARLTDFNNTKGW